MRRRLGMPAQQQPTVDDHGGTLTQHHPDMLKSFKQLLKQRGRDRGEVIAQFDTDTSRIRHARSGTSEPERVDALIQDRATNPVAMHRNYGAQFPASQRRFANQAMASG